MATVYQCLSDMQSVMQQVLNLINTPSGNPDNDKKQLFNWLSEMGQVYESLVGQIVDGKAGPSQNPDFIQLGNDLNNTNCQSAYADLDRLVAYYAPTGDLIFQAQDLLLAMSNTWTAFNNIKGIGPGDKQSRNTYAASILVMQEAWKNRVAALGMDSDTNSQPDWGTFIANKDSLATVTYSSTNDALAINFNTGKCLNLTNCLKNWGKQFPPESLAA